MGKKRERGELPIMHASKEEKDGRREEREEEREQVLCVIFFQYSKNIPAFTENLFVRQNDSLNTYFNFQAFALSYRE